MKKVIFGLIFSFFILIPIFPQPLLATTSNLINGGFETGDFTGWTRGTVVDFAGVVTADSFTTPYAGTYMARLGRTTGLQPIGPNIIYQDFLVVAPTLSFAYNIFTYDYAGFNHFSYLVQDLETGATIRYYSQGAWGTGFGLKTTGWQLVNIDLSAYLGRMVRLRFNVAGTIDTYNPTWVYLDAEELTGPTDNLPPTTTATLTGNEGLNNWYLSAVEVALTAIDNEGGSGVAQTKYSFDQNSWFSYTQPLMINSEGVTTLYYYSIDNAGNSETVKTVLIKIDQTPPVITINSPTAGFYLLNQPVLADWSVSDEVSGLASVIATIPNGAAIETGTIGLKNFEVRAVDQAGWESYQTITYEVGYLFSGILQPINADGSSIFKLGSTVPVKFRLTDFNNQSVSTVMARLYLLKISNNISGSVLEAVSSGSANSGNLFRYDNLDNLYIFNLGTKSLSTGTWQLEIRFANGRSEFVIISLR
ncbi:MAG: PxKF domain-containing protein [Patescibacteria group bacterium]|nr:PxKF domain-containing protein [Patescibacteria group bacterium]